MKEFASLWWLWLVLAPVLGVLGYLMHRKAERVIDDVMNDMFWGFRMLEGLFWAAIRIIGMAFMAFGVMSFILFCVAIGIIVFG